LKKVLVTGACGYIGSRLSKYLVETGYGVTAFDSFDPFRYSQWISLMDKVIIGDIRDENIISDLTEKEFDVVIHLISLDHHKSEDNPNFVSSINVMPTWNLLDKLTKNGLKKFIYFSTIQVYGDLPNKIITEDQPPKPVNTYGLTHLLSENICNYFNDKAETNCINVRLSNSYGSPVFSESNCWWLVINDLCQTAFKHKKIKLLSDGTPQRDFIHGQDVCKAIEILINTRKNINKNIFHIASGKTLTILELAHMVKEIYHRRYNIVIPVILKDDSISNDINTITMDNKFPIIDISRINNMGFIPGIDLSKGIGELFQYLEEIHE